MHRHFRYLLAAVACVASASSAAHAQVTYTYTSHDYNIFEQSNPDFAYNASEHLSFSVTLAAALAPNTGMDFNLMQVTWHASDGFHPIFGGTTVVNLFGVDDYNPPFPAILTNLSLHADGSGNIDAWYVNAFNIPFAGGVISQAPNPGWASQVNDINVADYVYSRPTPVGTGDLAKAGVTSSGTWTMEEVDTVTPEPATVTLFATGLLTIGIGARRRKRVA